MGKKTKTKKQLFYLFKYITLWNSFKRKECVENFQNKLIFNFIKKICCTRSAFNKKNHTKITTVQVRDSKQIVTNTTCRPEGSLHYIPYTREEVSAYSDSYVSVSMIMLVK
jgi:hypothetical protein